MVRPLLIESSFMVTLVLNFWMQDVIIIIFRKIYSWSKSSNFSISVECLN